MGGSGRVINAQIAKFIVPRWGPPGICWPQMGPMLAPMNLAIRGSIHTSSCPARHLGPLFHLQKLAKAVSGLGHGYVITSHLNP